MVDAVTLRQVLNAFLPTGGVVDRLGDNRERTREKACETLVLLGGFAYRSGGTGSAASKSKEGKGQETPLMVFEKFMREGGLASKVWKAREQVRVPVYLVSVILKDSSDMAPSIFMMAYTGDFDTCSYTTRTPPFPHSPISSSTCRCPRRR